MIDETITKILQFLPKYPDTLTPELIAQLRKDQVGDQLPVKARLVKANNQWRIATD